MQSVVKAPVNQDMAIVMSGITKVFIGEVVETGAYNSCCAIALLICGAARAVMEEMGETGPLEAKHLRESYRRLQRDGKIPFAPQDRMLFRR